MTEAEREALIVRVVDGTATGAEREALMALAVNDGDLRAELEEHMALKAVTDGWVDRLRADLDPPDTGGGLVAVGVVALIVALGLLTGGTVYEVFRDPEAPVWLQIGMALGAGGATVLLLAAVRWRMKTAKNDPYTEVIR